MFDSNINTFGESNKKKFGENLSFERFLRFLDTIDTQANYQSRSVQEKKKI